LYYLNNKKSKMKNIKYLFFILLGITTASCEFLESPDDTANVQEGFITFPALSLEGDQYVTILVDGTFEDPGAVATLGKEDITGEIEVSGEVDASTPGVYVLDYSVSVVNELDEVSSASQQRYVAVITESVADVDLSGTYNGDGTAVAGTWNQAATVTPISGAWYRTDKALASGNNLSIFFALVGDPGENQQERIIVPNQLSGFGFVNTTSPDTFAELINGGFQWTLFISCCGNFGPIIFTR
jgi:hypothetical protein